MHSVRIDLQTIDELKAAGAKLQKERDALRAENQRLQRERDVFDAQAENLSQHVRQLDAEYQRLRAALEMIASGNVGEASAPLVARQALDSDKRA